MQSPVLHQQSRRPSPRAAAPSAAAGSWLALLLLLSLFPTLSFMGHWQTVFLGQNDDPTLVSAWLDYAALRADTIEHSQHCHENLASCAAQPLPAGAGFLITQDQILFVPPFGFVGRLSLDVARHRDLVVSPLLPPPR